jgi:hypothetical protein
MYGFREHPQIFGVKFPEVKIGRAEKYIVIKEDPEIIGYPYAERYAFWEKLGLKV